MNIVQEDIKKGGLGAARPSTTDTASHYITADTPEATATFKTSQEISPHFPTESQTPLSGFLWATL